MGAGCGFAQTRGCGNDAVLVGTFQFTVTTRTPLHATKLPLRAWLSGLYIMLKSDKGILSIRLTEALSVSQPTALRMGHALRLMVGREGVLDGVVEVGLYVSSKPRRDWNNSPPNRGREGQPKTLGTPAADHRREA
jgi:hypothetical protein